jgi:hypothetical protein
MISLANCLQLASVWPGSNQVHFVLAANAPTLAEKRIVDAGFDCVRLPVCDSFSAELLQLKRFVAKWQTSALILDGKRFANSNLASLQITPARIACLKDSAIAQRPEFYIRRQQDTNAAAKKIIATARRIAVVVHQADDCILATAILNSLDQINGHSFSIDVCIDPANSQQKQLRELATSNHHSVRIHNNLANIDALLPKFDLAIVNFGTGCFHLACHGIPMIAIESCRDPFELRQSLSDADAVSVVSSEGSEAELHSAIRSLVRNRERRRQLSAASRQLVDGDGASRIVTLLTQNVSSLRKAS